MDTLTKILSYIAPGLASERIDLLTKLESKKRYYEAVSGGNHPRRWKNSSADSVMDNAKGKLSYSARFLDENHDIVVAVLDDLVTNVVGSGAGIEPIVKSKKGKLLGQLNSELTKAWATFWEFPEVTGEIPGQELERLICRSWLRDGEVFGQHVFQKRNGLSYQIEILEADFVPYDLVDANSRLIHGIQKNAWGTPLGYWVSKNHPGGLAYTSTRDYKWIPAENMMHIKFVRRLHQTRGVSVFHSVFNRLEDLKDYEESERIAARVASSFTAYVKKSADFEYSTEASTGSRNWEMEPGLIFDGLRPGEDVGVISTQRPNPELINFRNGQIRAIAGGTGARYSSISRDYNGTYSSQRQELVEGTNHYRRLFNYLKAKLYIPIWARFVDAARIDGRITIPPDVDTYTLYHPEVRPPQMTWIDPRKEIEAYTVAVQQGFRSRHQIIRDMGGDPSVVDDQLAADNFDVRPKSDKKKDTEK